MTDDSEGFSLGDLSSSGRKRFRSIRSKMTNSEIKYGISISSVHLSSCDPARRMKQLLNFFSDVSQNHPRCPSLQEPIESV